MHFYVHYIHKVMIINPVYLLYGNYCVFIELCILKLDVPNLINGHITSFEIPCVYTRIVGCV